jgi:hypothetical protein
VCRHDGYGEWVVLGDLHYCLAGELNPSGVLSANSQSIENPNQEVIMIFQIDGFLVCNTEEGEVKSAVANIFENGGEKMPIIQLGKIHFNAVVSGMLDLSEVIRSVKVVLFIEVSVDTCVVLIRKL